jgi:hypothetical protein
MAFDVITPAQLGRGAITTGTTTFYTVGSLNRAIVKTIDISNTTAYQKRVTVYLVPSGGSASDDNTLIPNVLVPGYGVFQWSGAQVLNEDDIIQSTASATGCTINISGGEAK